jgi:hypothetical protein
MMGVKFGVLNSWYSRDYLINNFNSMIYKQYKNNL